MVFLWGGGGSTGSLISESNPGQLGGKRELCHCALLSAYKTKMQIKSEDSFLNITVCRGVVVLAQVVECSTRGRDSNPSYPLSVAVFDHCATQPETDLALY